MFYLLDNESAYSKLKQELLVAFPSPSSPPTSALVEHLPYLISCSSFYPIHIFADISHNAVIQEGLRLGLGVSSRLQRISPNQPMCFQGWIIPEGTPVGMTSALIHQNSEIFPEPQKFVPERWIENPHLDMYLLSFSKGSRQCAGIK
jgi:cytochrome P450